MSRFGLTDKERQGIIKIHTGTSDLGEEIMDLRLSHEEIVASSLKIGLEIQIYLFYDNCCRVISD